MTYQPFLIPILQLARNSAVKMAHVIPAIQNTPLKLNLEKIGLNIKGGKN